MLLRELTIVAIPALNILNFEGHSSVFSIKYFNPYTFQLCFKSFKQTSEFWMMGMIKNRNTYEIMYQ